jgi:5'-methylthioinosine phosphorylase
MPELAVIGGTGLTMLSSLRITSRQVVRTPYGEPSGPLTYGTFSGRELVFLARHGYGHTIPPHQVNYRANLWALKEAGVQKIVAVGAVGGIRADMQPGELAVPDQIIDYTWGREQTYFGEGLDHVTHVDFTRPYCQALRLVLLQAGDEAGLAPRREGTYGATQGPRLETAAEIDRMERDGCAMVGMTGMPEAALARELELCYAHCAVVANWAAGRQAGIIDMQEIDRHLKKGMERLRLLLDHALPLI